LSKGNCARERRVAARRRGLEVDGQAILVKGCLRAKTSGAGREREVLEGAAQADEQVMIAAYRTHLDVIV
jgi:hypothetical protein